MAMGHCWGLLRLAALPAALNPLAKPWRGGRRQGRGEGAGRAGLELNPPCTAGVPPRPRWQSGQLPRERKAAAALDREYGICQVFEAGWQMALFDYLFIPPPPK